MAREFSKYQQKVINRYYDNLDAIMLQKLQELVTELYLAENDAARAKLWDRAHKAMVNLKIPPEVIAGIMRDRSTVALARQVEEWLNPRGKR